MTNTYTNIIGGVRTPSKSGRFYESRSPVSPDHIIGVFARSNEADGEAAVKAARQAFPIWSATPAPQRAQILNRAVDIMSERAEELARIVSLEMGKVFTEALNYDVGGAIRQGNYMVGEGRRMLGMTVPSEVTEKFACTVREPLGVVTVITPWNLPVLTPCAKIFAALICGNTIVFKPSEETAMAGYLIVEILEAAGLPDGVINLLTGYGAEIGDVLITSNDVNMVSFTGSTATGHYIGGKAGAHGKKTSLEMGGKNAIVVMDDADLDLAVEGALWGGYASAGQRCTASSRIILHEAIHDRFIAKFLPKVQQLRMGNPLEEGTQIGPIVNEKQRNKIHDYTQVGIDEGATLLTGGKKSDLNGGLYYEPTLFSHVTSDMKIAQEEIFGPSVAILKANDFEHAIELANSTEFGLSLAIYTQQVNQAFRAVSQFKSGLAYVNAPTIGSEMHLPFGGAKGTGNGTREYAWAAIDDYTELKTIFFDYSGKMRRSGM